MWTSSRKYAFGLWFALLVLPACRPGKPPDYQDETGMRFAPPTGWVERERPAGATMPAHRKANLPLPDLDARHHERLLVRYDRLTEQHAWMRLSVATVAATTSAQNYLANRALGAEWQREGDIAALEVNGKPAARGAWKRQWLKQDYLCEMTAVRRGEDIYLFTASFPADDGAAQEQIHQAVAATILP